MIDDCDLDLIDFENSCYPIPFYPAFKEVTGVENKDKLNRLQVKQVSTAE